MENTNKNRKENDENDEVEQLLRAAQDDVLLKLSVDSHIAHLSSNYLDRHLDRRFQALKSGPSLPKSSPSSLSQSQSQSQSQSNQSQSQSHSQSKTESTLQSVDVDDELKSVLGDDLSTRFAALKASSSSVVVGPKVSVDGDDEYEEDEVEKIMRWAKDAARLDPSPPSDDDDDGYDDKDSDFDDDDGDHHRKKGHRK